MSLFSRLTKMNTRLSLRWRVALVSFGLLVTILVVMGIIISTFEEQALLSNQANVLATQASIMGDIARKPLSYSTGAQPISSKQALEFIKQARSMVDNGTVVAILANDGKVIARSNEYNREDTISTEQEQALLNEWHSHNPGYQVITNRSGQRELVVNYQLTILTDKQSMTSAVGVLQLHTSTAVIDNAVASTRLLLALVTLGGLLVAAVLTLPLIKGALRPLTEIERTSTRIAGGDLSLRLTEPETRDELGNLARSFNSMVARLEKMFERQKRFVADVSHELRTPLTGIGGSLEMLLLEANNGDAEAARHLMQGMYAEVERMQRLVADLLVLSRLDEGQIKLRTQRVDVGMLLAAIAEQARALTQGQDIVCECPTEPLYVKGDSDHLRRIFLNPLENAIKFTPPEGRITLRADREQDADQHWIRIEVRDTGSGIPEEALPHIFDRFYRADQSRTRTTTQNGSGLGLSIAQGLVQAHDGSISITSTSGNGTTVTILLPALLSTDQEMPSREVLSAQ